MLAVLTHPTTPLGGDHSKLHKRRREGGCAARTGGVLDRTRMMSLDGGRVGDLASVAFRSLVPNMTVKNMISRTNALTINELAMDMAKFQENLLSSKSDGQPCPADRRKGTE